MKEETAKIVVAFALLLSASCGAYTAWRMSVTDDSMGDAYNDAALALIVDANASIRASGDVANHARAYMDFTAALANEAIAADAVEANTDETLTDVLSTVQAQQAIPRTVAKAYFPQRFVLRDGSYNQRADTRANYATVVGRRTADASGPLADAASYRSKTDQLVILLFGYSILVLLLACTEVIPSPLVNTIVATVCSLASIGLAIQTILIEQVVAK
jgi:hypothetical protein